MVEDGIHPALPRDRYDSIERCNFSTVKWFAKSAAHYRHVLTSPGADTDAKKVGRVVHLAAFEPERFRNAIAVWDGGTRRGKDWDKFKERNEGKELLTENEYDRCMAIQAVVSNHPIARGFVSSGRGEVTVLGTLMSASGKPVPVKGRMDFVGDAIADLKVTKDGSPDGFPRQVLEYHYDAQAPWYVDLLASVSMGAQLPYFIVSVEATAPHVVTVYRVPEFLLRIGRAKYQGWLDQLLECRRTSKYPGYAEQPLDLELPEWALRDTLEGEIAGLDLDFGGDTASATEG